MTTHNTLTTVIDDRQVLITGNTYPVREAIKALGGRWDKRAQGWLVPPSMAAKAWELVDNAPAAAPRRPRREDRYVSHIYNIGGQEYYRNKRGRCEDAPCCGCCTI
jgi:hypothetical protein